MLEKESAQGSTAIKWQGQDLNSGQPTPPFMAMLRANSRPRLSWMLGLMKLNKGTESQYSILWVALSMGETGI